MRRVLLGGWLFVGLGAFAGCSDKKPADAITDCQQTAAVGGAAMTDILFVVDDSASMGAAQGHLADSFQNFIEALAESPVANDYQIGVITTSINDWDEGSDSFITAFSTTERDSADCAAAPNTGRPFPAGALVRVTGDADPCSRAQDTTGTPRILLADSESLVTDFRENVFVGIVGSFKEQGLEAMRLALSEPLLSSANAGFLRPGARLAVIIVSDGDDCSDPTSANETFNAPGCSAGVPVQQYVDFLKGNVGGQHRDVVVAVIGAIDPDTVETDPTPQACAGSFGENISVADYRYDDFVAGFGSAGLLDSVCKADFSETMNQIAGLVVSSVLPLDQAPADWRMLSVSLIKSTGERIPCTVGLTGTEGTFNVVYTPPDGDVRATLTFRDGEACELAPGDRIDLRTVCAG